MAFIVLTVLIILWLLCIIIYRYKHSKKYLLSKYSKDGIVYNVASGLLTKHLLPNNGDRFDNEEQNAIHKSFIYSELGNEAIKLTHGVSFEE